MNTASVVRELRRARELITAVQLQDLDAGNGAVTRNALAAIDKAIEAGLEDSPRFPVLVEKASGEILAASQLSLSTPAATPAATPRKKRRPA